MGTQLSEETAARLERRVTDGELDSSFKPRGHRLVSARLAASPRAAREECRGPLLGTDDEEGLLQTPQGLKVWNSEGEVVALKGICGWPWTHTVV